jgi:hypothetical protein
MKAFTESLRYDYPDLTPESVILEIGTHRGQWAVEMLRKYGCRYVGFEPIREFFVAASKALVPFANTRLYPYAMGGSHRTDIFKVKGDMSGQFADGPEEKVCVLDVAEPLKNFTTPGADERWAPSHKVDLLAINAEGGEFEIMERILDAGLTDRIIHFQIQPHPIVSDFEPRWQRIMDRMAETHTLSYYASWVWAGWDRK